MYANRSGRTSFLNVVVTRSMQQTFFSKYTFPPQSIGDTTGIYCDTGTNLSTLKRLKIYLRNATGQERLTGLTLMSVHRDIGIDAQKVIDELAKQPRRVILC